MGDLPDDYADNPGEYDESIETLVGRADGPQRLAERQRMEQELQMLKAENEAIRLKYGIEDSRHDLFQDTVDEAVAHNQEFYSTFPYTEEGEAQIRRDLIQDWAQGGPKEKTSDEVYTEGYKARLQREQAAFEEE